MQLPFISPKLDVSRLPELDSPGLADIAEHYLEVHFNECRVETHDFGIAVRKVNKLITCPTLGFDFVFGAVSQRVAIALETGAPYLSSDVLLLLAPGAATPMSSHEYEIYEAVRVIFGKLGCQEDDSGKLVTNEYKPYDMFLSLCAIPDAYVSGFYHRLVNRSRKQIAIAHITVIGDTSLAMKEGRFMEFGFNCPLNTYVRRKSRRK